MEETDFSLEENMAISMASLMHMENSQVYEENEDLFHDSLTLQNNVSMISLNGSASSFKVPEAMPFEPLNPLDDDPKIIAIQRDDPMWNSVDVKKSDPIAIGECVPPTLNQLDFDNIHGSVNMRQNSETSKSYPRKWFEHSNWSAQVDQHFDSTDGQKLSSKNGSSKTKREKVVSCRTKHLSMEEKPSSSQTPANSSNFHHLVDYIKRFSSSPKGPGAEEKEKRPRHVVNELFKSFAHGSKTTESLPSTVSTRYRDRSLSVGGVPACRGKPDISCQAVYSIYDGILKEGNGGIFLSSKKTKAFEILKHPRFL